MSWVEFNNNRAGVDRSISLKKQQNWTLIFCDDENMGNSMMMSFNRSPFSQLKVNFHFFFFKSIDFRSIMAATGAAKVGGTHIYFIDLFLSQKKKKKTRKKKDINIK